jgi:uncharacterized protein with FMN-binding domain
MLKSKFCAIVFIILAVVLLAVGCGSKATSGSTSAGIYKDGTYEGSSDAGLHPGLKVKVVVKEGNISEVNIVQQKETEGVGTKAIEELPALIIKAQSTKVDSVSGASKTSSAIKEAVDKALAQAKK